VPAEIAIVVPLYNEAENVAPLAREIAQVFARQPRSWELVLVDDASTDTTWEQVLAAQRNDSRIRGLRHATNRGQSAAVWTGFEGTEAPLLCTLDGDLQNDPSVLPEMLGRLDEVDFICGRRGARKDSWVRKVSSRVAGAARQWALGYDFADTGCALRAFRRECLEGLFAFNGLHRFLPILVAAQGWRTREIAVNHRPRVAGVSKYGVWNRLGRGLHDLLGIRWYLQRRIRAVDVEDSRTSDPQICRPTGNPR
jgi:dolichol-phosphate mannosyltransferase